MSSQIALDPSWLPELPDEEPEPKPARKPARVVRLPLALDYRRLPATRFDCVRDRMAYPACPYLSCRHHLWHERAEAFDALVDRPPAEWPQTCSLDVADAVSRATPGTTVPGIGRVERDREDADTYAVLLTNRDVGEHLGVSRERARLVAQQAIVHLRRRPVMAEIAGEVDHAREWAEDVGGLGVDWYGGEE